MPSKTITFLSLESLPQRGDKIEICFTFSLLDTSLVGTPEEQTKTTYPTVIVKMSRSLQTTWNLHPPELEKIMFEYAERHLDKLVADGNEVVSESLDLYTSTAPLKCPYDPSSIMITPEESHEVIVKR